MAVTLDIFRAWKSPAAVFRRRAGPAPREDRALAVLITACVLIFAAQMPSAQRAAFTSDEVPLEALMTAALFRSLFIAPLVFYVLAWISHLVARVLGGKGTGYGARFALFWALLVASPLFLLWGMVAGFIGPGTEMSLVGLVALAGFVVHWSINLWTAETQ